MPPLLSVVVPTRNEEQSLPGLVDALDAALAGVDAEICVVDDSDDGTPRLLDELAAAPAHPLRARLRTGEERRGGLSTAVVEGLRMARGTWVCVMDADLQHPPAMVPAMLDAALGGADLVVACRYMRGGSPRGLSGPLRRTVSRAATVTARLLFWEARRSRDPLSGFFLCRRTLVDGIEFRPVGFKVLLELLVLLPGVRVVDVPLRFAARTEGTSKATLRQGVQYLRHLRSLVLDVPGSARPWKLAAVGGLGVGLFLPLLAIASGPLAMPALVAVLPAFAVAVTFNTVLNARWTFVDLRRQESTARRGYLTTALAAGVVMYGLYAGLVSAGLAPVPAGAVATLVAAALNGLANLPRVLRSPTAWSRLAADSGLHASLERVAGQLGAGRAYVVPPDGRADPSNLAGALVERAVRRRQALVATEAPSHRPQRRSNIDVDSALVVPVVGSTGVLALVVIERTAPHGFDQADLETAVVAVAGLAGTIEEHAGRRELSGPPALAVGAGDAG